MSSSARHCGTGVVHRALSQTDGGISRKRPPAGGIGAASCLEMFFTFADFKADRLGGLLAGILTCVLKVVQWKSFESFSAFC